MEKRKTIDENKELLTKLGGNKFNFDANEYKKAKSKINFECKKCGHFFHRTLGNLKRTDKCPNCEGKIHKHTQDDFLILVKEKWGDTLDTSEVFYQNIDSKITLTCLKHNYRFEQKPYELLQGKHTCKKCCSENASNLLKKDVGYYQNKLDTLYPNKFKVVNYNSIIRRATIKCLEHNQIFNCHISHMYKGHISCKCCKLENRANSDNIFKIYFDKPTTLYYIRFKYNNRYFYKIGITTKDNIKDRFYGKDYKDLDLKILLSVKYKGGREAYKEEQRYLRKYKDFKIKEKDFFLKAGNTEVFYKDVFNINKTNKINIKG